MEDLPIHPYLHLILPSLFSLRPFYLSPFLSCLLFPFLLYYFSSSRYPLPSPPSFSSDSFSFRPSLPDTNDGKPEEHAIIFPLFTSISCLFYARFAPSTHLLITDTKKGSQHSRIPLLLWNDEDATSPGKVQVKRAAHHPGEIRWRNRHDWMKS